MTRYAITGATGFTGGALAKALASDGAELIALVRDSSDTTELTACGIPCVALSLLDADAVGNALAGIDVVFHIAAAYRAEHSDVDEFHQVNVEATRVLLDASLRNGVKRFVHCSTVGVQGAITEPPASESYRLAPGDHYQQSKLDGEQLALSYAEKDIEVTVIRPVGIYGPGDERFLKLFKAIDRNLFLMIGSGETLYHLTYIDDLVNGFITAAHHPAAPGEVFTICGARYTTLNELADTIAESMGRTRRRWKVPSLPVVWAAHICDWICKRIGVAPPLYPRRVEFFLLDRAFTHAKASQQLNYEPEVGLEDGLQRTLQWYREQGLVR